MSILKVSIRQIKAARSLLGWSQDDLAAKSGVSIATIKRLEAEDGELGGRTETGKKIVAALGCAGVEFTNGGQPGVRIRRPDTHEAITSAIDELSQKHPPVDRAEPPSPSKAMRQLKHAHAQNEINKLKNRRAKHTKRK